jgi:hypothetical protein
MSCKRDRIALENAKQGARYARRQASAGERQARASEEAVRLQAEALRSQAGDKRIQPQASEIFKPLCYIVITDVCAWRLVFTYASPP